MLKGKVALVTGASRGIGREIAITLAGQGAYVIVNYCGSESAAKDTLNVIKENGGDGEIAQCDVGDFEKVKELIDGIVANHKTIDIIVNNAGITKDNLLLKMTEEDFDAVINTNLKSAFNTSKNAIRYMIKQRSGRIINMASIVGITGNAGQINYAAAKAGMIGVTKSLAREIASRGITVNAVAPGFIATDMTDAMPEAAKEATLNQIPLKRVGQPKDIADTVAFLASEKAAYITGQVISVDGGMAI